MQLTFQVPTLPEPSYLFGPVLGYSLLSGEAETAAANAPLILQGRAGATVILTPRYQPSLTLRGRSDDTLEQGR
jgi:hypothetical protein